MFSELTLFDVPLSYVERAELDASCFAGTTMQPNMPPSSTLWWIAARLWTSIRVNGWRMYCSGYQGTRTAGKPSVSFCPTSGRDKPSRINLGQIEIKSNEQVVFDWRLTFKLRHGFLRCPRKFLPSDGDYKRVAGLPSCGIVLLRCLYIYYYYFFYFFCGRVEIGSHSSLPYVLFSWFLPFEIILWAQIRKIILDGLI